jgi:ribose 5-phosphate isomerase B
MYIRIAIGSDHAGFELKEHIKNYLQSIKEHKIDLNDWGCYSEERVDYPDFAHKVANQITDEKADIGILVCGSGNGISMAANKWQDIRCALCWNEEIAEMAKLHNDANILSLPGRYITKEEAIKCVDAFLNTGFEGGRHSERISKIKLKND